MFSPPKGSSIGLERRDYAGNSKRAIRRTQCVRRECSQEERFARIPGNFTEADAS